MEEVTDRVTNMNISDDGSNKPTCVIVLGMAGSGKTTFVARLTAHLHAQRAPPYVINLDPACYEVPYPVNIDIRDTVKYKEVMKQYSLGPNGGIITSLNLFATRFDQVMNCIEKRSSESRYVIFDTPGQIEVFTWSASGMIITETLASTYPTVIVYVMDIVRSVSPITFMSNMLYACSILYKTKLPFVVAMNKIDAVNHSFALEWMRDFTAFQDALQSEKSYAGSLSRSMSLVLDEFYANLKAVGLSSLTGMGFDELCKALVEATKEYERDYKPEYDRLKKKRQDEEKAKMDVQMNALERDVGEEISLFAPSTSQTSSSVIIRSTLDVDSDDASDTEMSITQIKDNEPFKPGVVSCRRM